MEYAPQLPQSTFLNDCLIRRNVLQEVFQIWRFIRSRRQSMKLFQNTALHLVSGLVSESHRQYMPVPVRCIIQKKKPLEYYPLEAELPIVTQIGDGQALYIQLTPIKYDIKSWFEEKDAKGFDAPEKSKKEES